MHQGMASLRCNTSRILALCQHFPGSAVTTKNFPFPLPGRTYASTSSQGGGAAIQPSREGLRMKKQSLRPLRPVLGTTLAILAAPAYTQQTEDETQTVVVTGTRISRPSD